MLQDVCRVDMAQRRSVCTVSSPRIARTEKPSYVPFSASDLSFGKMSLLRN